jgi:hypothetical protein
LTSTTTGPTPERMRSTPKVTPTVPESRNDVSCRL